MYIRDIKPIDYFGINLLNIESPEAIMENIIEEPLKKPCKTFYKKGIRTVMSSANKNNIVQVSKKKKDLVPEIYLDASTFEDAGKGYAWIMLDFDSLSDENKDTLFQLEEKVDENGNKVGEEAIWFVHPTKIGNIDYMMKTGRISYDLVDSSISDEASAEKVKVDPRYKKFEDKAVILTYNNRYPSNTVILRRPVGEETTVEEVEDYFMQIAELLKDQKEIDKPIKDNKEDEGR